MTEKLSAAWVEKDLVQKAAMDILIKTKHKREITCQHAAESIASRHNLFAWLPFVTSKTAQDVLDDRKLSPFDTVTIGSARLTGYRQEEAAERLIRLCAVSADGLVLVSGEDAELIRLGE